ncbi:MAG: ROK family protein [Acidimicrobiales bacterium]
MSTGSGADSRHPTVRELSERRDVAVGVDIGGTKVLGVALAESGEILSASRVATPRVDAIAGAHDKGSSNRPIAIVDAVAGVVARVLHGLERTGESPAGSARTPSITVGVGVPGMLDGAGLVRLAPNLPAIEGSNLAKLLADALHGPTHARVVVANDANCAAVGEHELGAARGFDDALVVTLGTGIGGGLVSGGRVMSGAYGFAGEIGHMKVDPTGPQCPCGQRGCWERVASGDGLGMLAREAAYAGKLTSVVAAAGGDPEEVRGEHVTNAALRGDEEARAVVAELGWWVALGLANLTAILDPGVIVVGGGMIEAEETLMAPTRAAFKDLLEGGSVRVPPEIVPAHFGERAGAVGAALVGKHGGLP